MKVEIKKTHLLSFAGFMTLLLVGIYVMYPKYQVDQERQKMQAFWGATDADQASN